MILIDALKKTSIKPEFIAHIPFAKMVNAVTTWAQVFEAWTQPTEKVQDDDEGKFKWLWSGAVFDANKLVTILGTTAFDMIAKLALARVIYPDGTYNLEYVREIVEFKKLEEKYGRNSRA